MQPIRLYQFEIYVKYMHRWTQTCNKNIMFYSTEHARKQYTRPESLLDSYIK